jgi:hypothetical protein
VVAEPVTLADLAPTILDYAGVPLPAGSHGVSLREAARTGRRQARSLLREPHRLAQLRVEPDRGLRRGVVEAHPLERARAVRPLPDPGEAQNAIGREPQLVEDLTDRLQTSLTAWAGSAPAMPRRRRPRVARAHGDLGYVGGTMGGSAKDGPRPASKIHLEGEILQLRDLVESQAWPEASDRADGSSRTIPGTGFASTRGRFAATQIPDLAAARELARTCVERYPEFKDGVVLAARSRSREALAAAIDSCRRAREAVPAIPS